MCIAYAERMRARGSTTSAKFLTHAKQNEMQQNEDLTIDCLYDSI